MRPDTDTPNHLAGTAPLWALPAVLLASVALATAKPEVVLVVLLGAAGLVTVGPFSWRRCGRLLWRLKWFYLSLLVFFGVWPTEAQGAPAWSGLFEALWRIGALALVVVLVVWLTERFSRSQLVSALSLLLAGPKGCLGGWGRRFAQRLFLALALFEADRTSIEHARGRLHGDWRERLHAAREWLIRRLDQALSGDAWEISANDQFEEVTCGRKGIGIVIWLWVFAAMGGWMAFGW